MKSRGERARAGGSPVLGVRVAGEGSQTKGRPVFTPAGRPGR